MQCIFTYRKHQLFIGGIYIWCIIHVHVDIWNKLFKHETCNISYGNDLRLHNLFATKKHFTFLHIVEIQKYWLFFLSQYRFIETYIMSFTCILNQQINELYVHYIKKTIKQISLTVHWPFQHWTPYCFCQFVMSYIEIHWHCLSVVTNTQHVLFLRIRHVEK